MQPGSPDWSSLLSEYESELDEDTRQVSSETFKPRNDSAKWFLLGNFSDSKHVLKP